jgi:hypothetical protein
MHLSQPLLIVFAGTFVPYLDGWLNLFVPNVLRSLFRTRRAKIWPGYTQDEVYVILRGLGSQPFRCQLKGSGKQLRPVGTATSAQTGESAL